MFAESNPPCDADVTDDNNGHSNAVRPVASSKSSQVLHAVVWFEYCGYDDVEGWYIWCRDRKTCIPFWYFGDGVAEGRAPCSNHTILNAGTFNREVEGALGPEAPTALEVTNDLSKHHNWA